MKLKSYRTYKNDISDIIGILREQCEMGDPLSYDRIIQALDNLYDSHDDILQSVLDRIKNYTNMDIDDLNAEFEVCRYAEEQANTKVLKFVEKYPDVVNNPMPVN